MNSPIEVTIVWLATAPLGGDARLETYFNVREQESLCRQFGLPRKAWVTPRGLTPTDGFHSIVSRQLFGEVQRRTPYAPIEGPEGLQLRVTSISASVFPSDVAVSRVSARFDVDVADMSELPAVLAQLGAMRSSKTIPVVRSLFDSVYALAQGTNASVKPRVDYTPYFVMEVRLPVGQGEFADCVETNRGNLVNLLIGGSGAQFLTDELIDRVQAASADLNSKGRSELMLLNRQGVLMVKPSSDYRSPHSKRFEKTRDLATLAQFARAFIAEKGAVSSPTLMESDVIRNAVRDWIEKPSLMFESSVSNTHSWTALLHALQLEGHFNAS
jgi:hypothetical protein